jgi:hypothetical protein
VKTRPRISINREAIYTNRPGSSLMVAPKAEKAYEKYAWILFFVLGIINLIAALTFLIAPPGTGPPATGEFEAVIGMKWSQLVASNPQAANLIGAAAVYSQRVLGAFLLPLAVVIIAVSLKSYRRGEKWAWYAFLVLPVSFGVRAAIEIGLGFYSDLPLWTSFIVVSLLGLLLPYRKFFSRLHSHRAEGI